ncbi:unnamed protein product [Linum trigynum]|uniref:Uncharacterized protein n=1 Tax=Linum trigynum TaxID=586398 RepID=A0AAV2D202_9ROSI
MLFNRKQRRSGESSAIVDFGLVSFWPSFRVSKRFRTRGSYATRRKLPARLTGMKTWETKARRQSLRLRGEERSIKIGKREKLETAKSNHKLHRRRIYLFSL